MSRRDVETAVAASVPIIVSPLSHCNAMFRIY
jgi:hypothetical protein